MTYGSRRALRAARWTSCATLALAAAACTTTKAPPEQAPIVSANSSALAINANTTGALSSTSSQSVDIGDRKPDTDVQKKARLHLELAEGYYQDAKYPVALDELRLALQIDPSMAEAHDVLGLVYMRLGEQQRAAQSFQAALQLTPNDSDINNNYGWFLCQSGHESESFAYFNKATINPLYTQPAKALQNAGICALRLGDTASAEDYLKRSFERDPSGGVTAFMLAQIYYGAKDYERARFYVSLVNKTSAANSESLWLGIRVEHALNHSPEELSLSSQLQRGFPNSREAELLARHAYDD
jgi:type IV pilus assembly protein PilF